MRFARLAFFIALSFLLSPAEAQQDLPHPLGLTNDAVLAMVRERFDDPTIGKMIQRHDCDFDLSVDALIRLKHAGVSQTVLDAMVAASPVEKVGPPPAQPAVAKSNPTSGTPFELPDEIGAYVRRKEKLVETEPEIVNWQTGGVVKHMATLGLDREHMNGTVTGPHSSLDLASSWFGYDGGLEFVIRCANGTSASEYQLLRFWEKSDRREFRSVTGGVLHASGGAKDNVVQFQFQKLGPQTYKVKIPALATGEYGFLAPGGASSATLASQGKVYTFHIVE